MTTTQTPQSSRLRPCAHAQPCSRSQVRTGPRLLVPQPLTRLGPGRSRSRLSPAPTCAARLSPTPSRRSLLTAGGAGALAATLSAALAACSGGDPGGAASGSTVTVVTHDSFSLSEDLLAAFEADTGYTLTTLPSGDTGELVNRLVLTKDAPLGDAVYGIDNTYASRALAEGVIDTTAVPALPPGADGYVVEDTPALAPVDVGDVCLNIDTAYFADRDLAAPSTFEDLADSDYAPLLVAIDPSTSSTGLAWMLATVGHFGTGAGSGFASYWKTLVEGGTRIDAGWSDAYYTDFTAGGGQGSYPVVVSYSSSPAYTLTDDGSATTTAALPATAFRQVEYAGVLTGAANPEGGRAFVEWMLSRAVQEDIPGQMYMYPVDAEASLPPELESFGPLAPDPVTVSPQDITAHREEWLSAWSEAVGA
ncbi:thiamine ABC transporter substrate-binding protein [Actinomyces sp. 2119]|nr:thiamine ABC transporter substrate-binding protein [Actinomyces sp. 2119]RJF41999.1 thiamine ABC transporter substrate-binding protein [Actinomyces sp. 2119]